MDKGEELVQECFFNIWEIRKRLNISTSVKFYLFRAVKNRCLNFLKQEQNRRGILYSLDEEFVNREEFFIESVSDTESHTKMENRISEAMNLLPAGCREIFEMGKMSGMTYRQIADELNISVKTVENQMSKALRILRKELSSEMFLLLCFFRKE